MTQENEEARPTLACMSGSLKGCTLSPAGDRIVLGMATDCEVRFPPSDKRPVAERHAELVFRDGGWFLTSLVPEPIILNETPVKTARLEQNDLFRLGPRGPLLRFHLAAEDAGTKSFRQILMDSAAFSREEVQDVRRTSRVGTFARQVIRDAVDHGTRRLKFGVAVGSIALIAALGLAVWQTVIGAERNRQLQDIERRNTELSENQRDLERQLTAQFEANERLREELGVSQVLAEEFQLTLTELRNGRDADKEQIEALVNSAKRTDEEMDRLRGKVDAARKIRSSYARGVAMIAVGIAFWHEGKKKFVREPSSDSLTGAGFELGGDGDRIVEWVTGSGFLVDDEGLLVSNRHVIDPWWKNEGFGKGLLRFGFKPVRVSFLAFFPDRTDPLNLERVGSADEADIAFARVKGIDPEWKLPVLTLAQPEDQKPSEGEATLLLGFPQGVQGLVNILEDRFTKELREIEIGDLSELLRAIAARGGIRPSMTAGVLSAITSESYVYDAVTTSGGSGGPVFSDDGRVIGVNTAVSREFSGHNFGTAIHLATEVMRAEKLLEMKPGDNEIALANAIESDDEEEKEPDAGSSEEGR